MKNLKALLLLFLANSISAVAQGISMIAIPWYFTELGQMEKFAWIYIFVTMIGAFWGPYAGTLIDKYNRKVIFMALAVVMGISLGIVSAWGFYQGQLQWYWVGLAFILTFLNYNIHFPAMYAFAQEIVDASFYGKLSSYLEIQHQFTTVLAGAGAAMLLEGTEDGVLNLFGFKVATSWQVAPWEIYEIFLLDASTYFIGFVIISLITYESVIQREKESGGVFQQFKVGITYLKANKGVSIFGVASFSVFLCMVISHFYLFPIYVKNHLQEEGDVYAAGDMYYAVGAIFAGLAIRHIFKKQSVYFSVTVMTIVAAIAFFILGFSNNLVLFYGLIFLLGVTNAGVRIQRITYLLNKVPNQVYGRANSIFFISHVSFRILFLTAFSFTFFLNENNIIYAFYIFSGFLLATVLILFTYRKTF